jgi:hypothetical protein
MDTHTPHLTEPGKTGWSDFQNWMFRFLLASFRRLVFGDKYKSFPPPSFGGCWCYPRNTFILSLCELSPTPLWESCDLWEILSGGLRESPLWALEHLIFVKQSLWRLLLMEVKPPRWLGIALELPSVWWVLGKFVKVRFASERKEAMASKVRKAVEKRPDLELALWATQASLTET